MPQNRVRLPDTTYTSTSTEKSAVISTTACTVFDILAYNSSGSDIYLQVFNTASLPADTTAVQVPPVLVLAGTSGGFAWAGGRPFTTGCTVVASSTALTKTLVGSNSVNLDANFFRA